MTDETRQFIERLFNIENDIKMLRLDRKQLITDFKETVDIKTVMKVISLVKAKVKLGQISEETILELTRLVEEKIDV